MSKALTTKEFIQRAKQVHDNKYDYSKVNYINGKTKVCIICTEHGEFWQKAENHININNGCPKCAVNHKTIGRTSTKKDFIKKAKEIHGNKYDYSKVNYINNHTKICIICKEHGNFWQIPNSHLNKCGCPKCSIKYRKLKTSNTLEIFIKKAIKIHGNKYNYSKSFYIKNKEKIEIICTKHSSFWQKPNAHLCGQGCPKCQRSIGENTIEKWLIDNNIQYETQKRFKNCRDRRSLPFDFYLPNHNILLEYDGKQHFKPTRFNNITEKQSNDNLQKTIIKDKIKDQYCIDNNIDLLRIPYTEFKNINKLLTENIRTC